MQDYMLRYAKISSTNIECINIVKYKNSMKSWVPAGPLVPGTRSPGPLFIPTLHLTVKFTPEFMEGVLTLAAFTIKTFG